MLLDETKFVTKRVRAIKTTLSPRLRLDGPKDRPAGYSANASEVLFEIVHCEIQVVRIWLGVPRITVSPRIEARKYNAPAAEIMPPRRDPPSWLIKDSSVEDGSVLDAGYWNNNAIYVSRRHISSAVY